MMKDSASQSEANKLFSSMNCFFPFKEAIKSDENFNLKLFQLNSQFLK